MNKTDKITQDQQKNVSASGLLSEEDALKDKFLDAGAFHLDCHIMKTCW